MDPIDSNLEQDSVLALKHKYLLSIDKSAPLVLFVHGRAGNYNVMWTFRRCVPDNFNIIAPEAFLPDPLGGFSWWLLDSTKSKDQIKLEIELAAHKLRQFIVEALKHHKLQPRAIIALGFSQGGAILSRLIFEQPQLLDGLGLLASFVIRPDSQDTLISDRPNIFMAHGTQDTTISIEKARKDQRYLAQYFTQIEYYEDPVGHKVGSAAMRQLKEWLRRF